ncbi:hypothetical protein ACFGVS_19095 [Mucilaginibacter sp. AW1-7]|uniref:hypothetical protein n=1 Tax=Mucilaginibacter sp. AW1-7 TaxID=3349874 RepID=UPI003F735303
MELLKIYFTVEKNLAISDILKQMISNKLTGTYNKDRSGYLANANTAINADEDIRSQIKEILKKDKHSYETVSFKANITVANNNESWYIDFPQHNFEVKIKAKSIVYHCLKVIDGSTFVGFDPSNNEILTLKKDSSEKVYFFEAKV